MHWIVETIHEVLPFAEPLVVSGAPLAVDGDAFQAASGNVVDILKEIVNRIRVQ